MDQKTKIDNICLDLMLLDKITLKKRESYWTKYNLADSSLHPHLKSTNLVRLITLAPGAVADAH